MSNNVTIGRSGDAHVESFNYLLSLVFYREDEHAVFNMVSKWLSAKDLKRLSGKFCEQPVIVLPFKG